MENRYHLHQFILKIPPMELAQMLLENILLNLEPGEYTIVFSYIGYDNYEKLLIF